MGSSYIEFQPVFGVIFDSFEAEFKLNRRDFAAIKTFKEQ